MLFKPSLRQRRSRRSRTYKFSTGLLITDAAAAGVRPTFDVDAICEITSYAEYVEFSARLQQLGFSEDASEGAPPVVGASRR